MVFTLRPSAHIDSLATGHGPGTFRARAAKEGRKEGDGTAAWCPPVSAARTAPTLFAKRLETTTNIRFIVTTVNEMPNRGRQGIALFLEAGISRPESFPKQVEQFDFEPLASSALRGSFEVPPQTRHRLLTIWTIIRTFGNLRIPVGRLRLLKRLATGEAREMHFIRRCGFSFRLQLELDFEATAGSISVAAVNEASDVEY